MAHISFSPPPAAPGYSESLQKLGDDLESLLITASSFSDVTFHLLGRFVPLHRCILSARSPFLKTLFLDIDMHLTMQSSSTASPSPYSCLSADNSCRNSFFFSKSEKQQHPVPCADVFKLDKDSKLTVELHQLIPDARLGYDAFMAVVHYLYGGSIVLDPGVPSCMDAECAHQVCRPAISFLMELLCAATVFQITHLKCLVEQQLVEVVEKLEAEDVVDVLSAACAHGAWQLEARCVQVLAVSNLDIVDMEKHIPAEIVKEVKDLRGCDFSGAAETEEKCCRRIYRALDCDDVELVQMLLKESSMSMNSTYSLHYACGNCDAKIMLELLAMGKADPNLKNRRGFTALHVAARRKDPSIILALLSKGADPLEVTEKKGLTALQMLRKSAWRADSDMAAERVEEFHRDRLCIHVLEQAEKIRDFVELPLAIAGEDLFMKLMYLENRVSLAKILFPREAQIVQDVAQSHRKLEITGVSQPQGIQKMGLDWHGSSCLNSPAEAVQRRVEALQRAMMIGRRFFPRFSEIITDFLDDDLSEFGCIEKGTPEERKLKKKRYMELKDTLADTFRRDFADMDKELGGKCEATSSCSSSSCSSRAGSRVTKITAVPLTCSLGFTSSKATHSR